MSAKPFSTYPEDRERLLSLARSLQTPGVLKTLEDRDRAADKLSDLVKAILEDEAIAAAHTSQSALRLLIEATGDLVIAKQNLKRIAKRVRDAAALIDAASSSKQEA